MSVLFSEPKPCPRCGGQPEQYKDGTTGRTGFACNDKSHSETPERSEPAIILPQAVEHWNAHVAQFREVLFPRLKTLRDLEQAGRHLKVGCFTCGTKYCFQPSSVGLDLDLAVTDAVDQLECNICGKSNGTSFYSIYAQPARRS